MTTQPCLKMSREHEQNVSFFGKLLSYLEDSRYPSVGPHIRFLRLTGLWHESNSKMEKIKLYIFYITVAFFGSQYIRCLMKFNAESLTLILQYTPFHMGIVKSCFFHKDYKKWKSLIFYMSSLERNQLSKKNEQSVEVTKYIKHGRRATFFYWALAFLSNFNIIVFCELYQKDHENENGTKTYTPIFDGYIPYSNGKSGYYVTLTIQTFLGHVVSAYVTAWDSFVVAILVFFAGQLKVAGVNCRKMIRVGSDDESHENIVLCHRHYTKLVEYQNLFNELISPVMFVHIVVISVNLGVCIIQIAEDDVGDLISNIQFVLALLIQMLLFYWHANEVTEESLVVSYSTFESDWLESAASVRKEVVILGLTYTKRLVFRAGAFNEMSLLTFTGILRASYSFYTLLSNTNK